jgi:hypothetical protein
MEYGRQVEDYLCRKNGGHLIRIKGPAWEMVCGWESRGIPVKVVFGGIDRYLERQATRRTSQRRPVPIEFCEADVLAAFDQWRRAVGIATASATSENDGEGSAGEADRRHGSLPAHLDRVIARLTSLRAGADRRLDQPLDSIVRELDALRARSKGLRGEARDAVLARLQSLDGSLLADARALLDPSERDRMAVEADTELAPFRGRLTPDDYARARAASIDRLVRERWRLPSLTFE